MTEEPEWMALVEDYHSPRSQHRLRHICLRSPRPVREKIQEALYQAQARKLMRDPRLIEHTLESYQPGVLSPCEQFCCEYLVCREIYRTIPLMLPSNSSRN